jgi:O-antigen/teichoic acid export membrane protein
MKLSGATVSRAVTTSLRATSLISKLALTLYMGRYLPLSDLGSYGLVFGTAMVLTVVLGLRIDHVVSRELVRAPIKEAAHKIRDELAFYASNYLLLSLLAAIIWMTGAVDIPGWLVLFTLAITVTDSLTNLLHVNLVALERPIAANVIFSGCQIAWCATAILLGLIDLQFRTVEWVLTSWLCGNIVFILLCCAVLRPLLWKSLSTEPISWHWLRNAIRGSVLIWIGTVGIMAGSYVDRFVGAKLLSLSDVGIITFYSSFANTVFTLAQAGMVAVSAPGFIALYRSEPEAKFRLEFRKLARQVGAFAAAAAIVIAAAVPLLSSWSGRQELVENSPLLWLLLFAAWLRCNAECLFIILYARGQDRAIWSGNLYFLIPALIGNVLFISLFGILGVGLASVVASAFLFSWRRHYSLQDLSR